MNEIDTNEAITTKAGRWLIQKEFSLVSCVDKVGCPLAPTHAFGLLHKDFDAKPKKCFLGFIKKEPTKSFFGILWFNNSMFGADVNNWVFEVHDKKDLILAKQLSQEMTSAFGVKISLCLG